ncbi:MAG: alpha-keto acid decarboxylase family protein [Clostridium perfringens]|nr:alpha-keto acid decarboxylase family protein [Clostridium perfringens]
MTKNITVGNYLIKRLKELGIKDIFGVPGDYNLLFLDQIDDAKDLNWIGNCNELNAAYAADGYARINGMGAVVTTFGVGELSAINGIAGSFAEHVPVVKIVGMPSTEVMKNKKLVHHTLGEGIFNNFSEAFKQVTVDTAILNAENAASQIDSVLCRCFLEKRPVYIGLPINISGMEICDTNTPLPLSTFKSNKENLENFIETALNKINNSKAPIILADFEVNRYNLNKELLNFVEKSGLPIASLGMGKGVINETHPQFIGTYNGTLSNDYIKDIVKGCDCFILLGVKLTDSITAGFSYIHDLSQVDIIDIHPLNSNIDNKTFNNVYMKDVLAKLSSNVTPRSFKKETYKEEAISANELTSSKVLTQKAFFNKINNFVKPNDVILAEQGTSFFGACTLDLKENCSFIGQPLWGSIGYTLGSLLGTQIADKTRRNILLIGDGSFQLTAQELSTMLWNDLNPIIFVINNDGYTVERYIHGPNRHYNDINMWDYKALPKVFNGESKSTIFKVTSAKELDETLEKINTITDKLIFVEIVMGKMDAPKLLQDLANRFSSQNQY